MTHFAMSAAAAVLLVLVGCSSGGDDNDEACTVALIEGHDAYYDAYCDD